MIDKPQATHLLLLCVLSCVILFAIPNPLVASVFCEKCGQEIRGDYIVVEDRSYHSHHVQCFLCEKGFNGQFLIYNGQPAHRACLNEESSPLPRCSLCKQAIWSAYEVDYWGNTYHPEHAENLVPCPYCSRGISNEVTAGGHRFPDGREVCGICLESAVLEPEQVREVAMEIRGYLRDLGIDIDPRTFPIELVGRDQLKSIRGLDSNVEGYTKYSVSNQYRSEGGSRSTLRSSLSTVHVYVLTGLPRMRFVGVLTHELMHAWLSSQGLNDTKPEFLEGSCNYVAYRVLENYAGKEAAYERLALESNTDPEYGLGFRRVLTMVQEKGHRHWLQRIQKEQDFPRGF